MEMICQKLARSDNLLSKETAAELQWPLRRTRPAVFRISSRTEQRISTDAVDVFLPLRGGGRKLHGPDETLLAVRIGMGCRGSCGWKSLTGWGFPCCMQLWCSGGGREGLFLLWLKDHLRFECAKCTWQESSHSPETGVWGVHPSMQMDQ